MKKTLGRLGAMTAAVGMIAIGLVGFAGPAHAGEINTNDYVRLADCGAAEQLIDRGFDESVWEEKWASTCRDELIYVGYTKEPRLDDYSLYTPYGCRKADDCKPGAVTDLLLPDEAYCDDKGKLSEIKTDVLVEKCGQAGADLLPPYVNKKWTDDKREYQYYKAVGKTVNAGETPPPPPPCWSAEALNNCPVGGALRFAAPRYAMVGVPVTMYAYASWRPDANSPAQPTNGSAVIRVDGEDYSGVEFKDGVAEWRFIPETEGMKEFTASGVLFSGLSGANAYIDTVPARTYVLEYDPAAYAAALKKKAVEVGDTYVITDPNQARSYAEDRYEWSVSEKSDDVCAVYETQKGAVKAKFNGAGKCTVIWLDKESEESGKYTFIAKK